MLYTTSSMEQFWAMHEKAVGQEEFWPMGKKVQIMVHQG
jgi:hypothetical protein